MVRGALIIAIGGFIAKLLGALYRIPLVNILGGEGMGIYETVYPVYCLLLTLACQGLPQAISKLVAQSPEKARSVLRGALFPFSAVGLAFSLLMAVSGGILSRIQGVPNAASAYCMLAPSVLAVSVLACFRGYFQGKNNMVPTAVSQVIEQAVKLAFGLTLCLLFGANPAQAAALAMLAVTISECAALGYLFIRYKRVGDSSYAGEKFGGRVVKLALPIAFAAVVLPIIHIIDSFSVVNIIGAYNSDAGALFGIYGGCVNVLLGLPAALAYGIAVAAVPAIAVGGSDGGGTKTTRFALKLTFLIGVPFFAYFLFFSRGIVGLLYGSLSVAEREFAAQLLSVSAISALTLCLIQTTNSVLVARGRQMIPFLRF